MNHQNTFYIICSFLGPLELVRTRRLDRLRKDWTDQYLKKDLKLDTVDLEEKACPICGDFLEENDISSYTGFVDLTSYAFYSDGRIDYIEMINEGYNCIRSSLLCDTCEYKEDYDEYNHWELDNLPFRYKGKRIYQCHIVNDYILPWTFIFRKIGNNILWNQYQKVNDPIEYNEEIDEEEDSEYIW
jgi:hypothetical protein